MNTPIKDLFALAEEAIAPVIWTEKKALKKFKESVTPERVREVAEAFRALEQRAEAAEAEAKHQLSVNILVSEHHNRLSAKHDALQAKLAGMEKQEPYGYVHKSIYESCGSCSISNDHEAYHHSSSHIPLFTRPAPAINRAELAPDGWKLVPVEPTTEMLEEIRLDERFKEVAMKRRYQALLAAAPIPPQ